MFCTWRSVPGERPARTRSPARGPSQSPHASLCGRPRRQRTQRGGPVPLCTAAQAEAAVSPPLDRADDSVCFHVRHAALEALKMGSTAFIRFTPQAEAGSHVSRARSRSSDPSPRPPSCVCAYRGLVFLGAPRCRAASRARCAGPPPPPPLAPAARGRCPHAADSPRTLFPAAAAPRCGSGAWRPVSRCPPRPARRWLPLLPSSDARIPSPLLVGYSHTQLLLATDVVLWCAPAR